MSWKYDGEDDCISCKKFSEVNKSGECKSCYRDLLCKDCMEIDCECIVCESCDEKVESLNDNDVCDECAKGDDRGDSDFNERGGYSRSYINSLNNGI